MLDLCPTGKVVRRHLLKIRTIRPSNMQVIRREHPYSFLVFALKAAYVFNLTALILMKPAASAGL